MKTKKRHSYKHKNKNTKRRKRAKRKKQTGGGFFDYFTRYGRQQMLFDECDKKDAKCQINPNNCDCTVGIGLQKLSSNSYCIKKNNRCVKNKTAQSVVDATNKIRWVDFFLKGFSFN